MKRRTVPWGCIVAVLLIVALLAAGGAWWFFIGQFTTAQVPPASPVQVYLLSPSSGDELEVGDFVSVNLQAVAPEAISWSEVFVDGASLGAVTESPEGASWTWQAWPAGIHVLSGRALAADGQLGESQTVIVNVLALSDVFQASAGEGQTLGDVGANFGVPPDQMAGANPKIDPSKPLADGQPVNVPTGAGGAGVPQPAGGGGDGAGGGKVPFLITWELKLTGPVDKSYCYLSNGSGTWDKMPKQPFEFFGGLENLYTQVFDVTQPSELTIQAQCWGWLAGALKYLGQGETKSAAQGPIQISGDGFQLVGMPQWPEANTPQAKEIKEQVPAPYALRQPKDEADCTAHAAPIVGPFICKTLMSATVTQYRLLEWEWQPGLPGTGLWINDIAGYELYEILPDSGAPPKYLKSVKPLGARAAAVPVPWGLRCYGVKAYAEGPQYGGKVESEMATFCPGQPPATQKVTQSPSHWMTTGGAWISENCNVSEIKPLASAAGSTQARITVGSWVEDYGNCYEEGDAYGAVKFPAPPLPNGAVIQQATLKFSKVFLAYGASGTTLGAKPQACADTLGTGVKDWTWMINNLHFAETPSLGAFDKPLASMSDYMPSPIDVTTTVKDWYKNPSHNHGFIFDPVAPPQPSGDGSGECISGLGNFQLDVFYHAP